jgi:hypothetical protein
MRKLRKIYAPPKPTTREVKRDLLATFLNHLKIPKL